MKLAECHPNRKAQARGLCKSCYDKWLKTQNPEYRERQLGNSQKWIKANPEKAAAIQQRRKDKVQSDPQEQQRIKILKRESMLLKNYGITSEDYEKMLATQGGGCAICERKPGDRPLHVDHCHASNVVRGLLCHQCNWYLGTLEGGPGVFARLIDYLRTHKSPALLGLERRTDLDDRWKDVP